MLNGELRSSKKTKAPTTMKQTKGAIHVNVPRSRPVLQEIFIRLTPVLGRADLASKVHNMLTGNLWN